MKEMSLERIKEYLEYNPETGIFTWRKRPSNRVHIGDEAGHRTRDNYLLIRIFGRIYCAHRLAWWMVRGIMPPDGIEVDHINHIPSDNRFCNLRLASKSENGQNRSGATSQSLTKVRGVYWDSKRGKYSAEVMVGGVKAHRSRHVSLADAEKAVIEARTRLQPYSSDARGGND
jgi:hypothetical protein